MKRYQILHIGLEKELKEQYILVGESAFQTLWEFLKAIEVKDKIEKLDGDIAASTFYVCGRDE